jgi:restriction system protein
MMEHSATTILPALGAWKPAKDAGFHIPTATATAAVQLGQTAEPPQSYISTDSRGEPEKEVDRCVLKIAKIEGDERVRDVEGEWMFEIYELPQVDSTGVHYGWLKYERLQRNLKEVFRVYHAKCKANPPTETFDELSGVDFEVYLTRLLKKLGFEDVTGTPATGDQGADLLAKKDGRKIAIQAKRYKGRVGNETVQEVVGALKFYKADEGWVITSGRFTQSARALAQANDIHLVDGLDLRKLRQG